MVTKFMMDEVERDLSVPEKPTGIMTFNPAGRTMLAERIQRVKDKYKEFTTPAAEGLPSLYEGNILDLAMMDVGARKLGLDEPRTFGNMYNFLQFEGQNMSPAEELASVKGDNLLGSDFKTFQRMVDLGLVSTSETGEVFRPTIKVPGFEAAGDTAQRSSELDINELSKVYLSGDYSPSNLYTESLGEKVSDFRNLERGMQGLEKIIAAPGGAGAGFMGGDPNLRPQYVGAELGGQDVTHDYINEKFLKAMPIDQDPTENKEFMALLKEFDPIRHENILYLKDKLKTEKNISARERLLFLYKDAIGSTTNLGDGRKLVAINKDPADPGDFNIFSDIAAPGSPEYVRGQFSQLGIEFVPFFGVFDDVVRQAVRATGKGLSKIFGKDADKLEFVCGSPCKLTPAGKAALAKAVKNGKITQQTANALEAKGKLLAESQKTDPTRLQYGNIPSDVKITLSKSATRPADKNINQLYNDITSGKINLEEQLYGYQINVGGKQNPLFDKNSYVYTKKFEDMTKNEKKQLQTSLYNYGRFIKNKGDKLSPDELQNLFKENIPDYVPYDYFSSVVRADRTDASNSVFGQTVRDILQPGRIEGGHVNAIFFKPPTETQLKKIADAYKNRYQTPLTTNQIDRINKISGSDYINNIMLTERRLPELNELKKVFPNLTDSQLAKTVTEYINLLSGKKFFTGTQGTINSVRKRAILADELFNQLRTAEGNRFNFYRIASYNAALDQMDNVILRNVNQATMKRNAGDILRNNGVTKGEIQIHEPTSIVTAARFNMHSYANFIVPQTKVKNQIDIPKTQSYLSRLLVQLQEGKIKLPKLLELYDANVAKNGLKTNEVVTILPPTRKAIENWYGKKNVQRYLDEFGMDLVGEAKEAGFAFGVPKNSMLLDDFVENGGFGYKVNKGNAMGGTPISREKFVVPGSTNDSEEERMRKLLEADAIPGTIANSVKRSLEPVQDQIRGIYEERLQPYFDPPLEYATLKKEELEKELSDRLNPPKPVKFKFSELPRLITQGPLAQAVTTDPAVVGLETIEYIYNSLRRGVENDIEMKDKFPKLYAMNELTRIKGPGVTPKESDYISAIDEINRVLDTGLTNFAYNVGDLLFSVPDAILPTEFTDELKRRYEKSDLAKPETFVGEISAVALEFGIPGGIAFKLINRFRKFTAARTGGRVNLFTQKTYGLEGLPKLGVQISNVFKRVGTGAVSFGAGDFIAGGPYNTISEMFDDPLLTSKYVGKYEDTSELSGKERVLANFKNRLRFAGEGAIIGGLFPLVGPALGAIGKQTLLKPALFLGGGALKVANTVAIKPATYLASLDPVVLPGIARGTGAFAKFLGQDVLARLAATAATGGRAFVPSLKGNFGQLPEFSKWRMFDVTSNDPLERGLKKVDNFLKWFRDSGNQALYGFNLSGGAERFIKAKSREIEKYLESIEKKAYDLANGFLGRYNKGFTSPAGERQMLEQVFEYLRGNLKLSKIEPELQEMAKVLKDEFNALKQAYFKELPEGSGLKAALESNLDKYMRMSFATFTNPNFTPSARVVEQATDFMVDIIMRNEDFLEAAVRGVGATGQTAAIREFARKNVENIITIGKREGVDPINALNKINREILRGDDVFLQTGEELPQVIRNLLGQEKSLRNSVMMTTGALVSQTANIRAFKEFARHGLENGYLFTSRAEALAAGVADPRQILELPGLGPMQDLVLADRGGPIGLFASNELKQTMQGTGGMLDSLLQNSFYQSLIAYKAAVQTGKTVFSPATQTRNFGSAGFFPMHVGHIGGAASVTDSFKIVMDDIFGAGRTVNEADLIKRISRKIELGVLDENIVASELGAILKDIKAGKLQSLGKLAERVENTKFYKQATRVYAGGDNVWKWYGHEYYMSQLKGAFRNIDDVKRFFEEIHGIEFNVKNIMTGSIKTLDEGIEEAAAFLLRETYPTYSKVPEFIKAIRKLPIGNFVSFTSEILRTGFSTSAIAMKHIASDNQALREMGYRMLSGQAITLGGMTAGTVALGHALTNVTPTQMEVYKQYFAPEYMQYSTLIPVSNHKDGTFKVFDLSRYNPYDIIVSSAKELMKVAERKNYSKEMSTLREQLEVLDPDSVEAKAIRQQMKDLGVRIRMNKKLDSDKIETSNLKTYLNAVGPLYNAVTGTFFGIPIGAEAFIEAYTGRTRQGSPIWSKGMTPTEIFDRAMGHFFKTIEPGIISSGRKLFYSARGDVSGVGQPLEIDTELFKLAGGSNVTVDILGSLDFKISDFQKSFREARVAKDFFSTENFKSRGPDQLVREYREQNEQAFRAQYEFYKAATAAIDSGLITRTQVIRALTNRISPGSETVPQKVLALMDGRYTALSYGPEGLKSRREKIIRNNPDIDRGRYSLQYFLPFGALENEKNFWNFKKFSDFEERPQPERQREAKSIIPPKAPRVETEPVVPEIADTPIPQVQAAAPAVSPVTGLTTTETALLSPGEQAIRLRQKQGIA
jgi:hypothetical protein